MKNENSIKESLITVIFIILSIIAMFIFLSMPFVSIVMLSDDKPNAIDYAESIEEQIRYEQFIGQ